MTLDIAFPKTRGANNRIAHAHADEAGIIDRILEILGIEKGWCVELGAADGTWFSNTRLLLAEKGWSGVQIEADERRFKKLGALYADRDDVICIKSLVSTEGRDSLDEIFARTDLPRDFDFFSLDIDGNDYHIWDSLKTYRPKLMAVEFNGTIPNEVIFVQPCDASVSQGASLAALIRLGKEKGYELVATTFLNAFFVRKEDFSLFNIDDNSIDAMCSPTAATLTQLFQLYDGTIQVAGNTNLIWQEDLSMRPERFQVLPKPFRFVSPPSRLKKYGKRFWSWLYRKKLIR